MALLREIASLGRSARMEAKLKVRQPLSRVEVTLADELHSEWLKRHDDIVREEINVKEIHYACGASPFVEYSVQPNFRRLGPRVGPLLPKVKQALATASGAKLLEQMTQHGKIALTIDEKNIELDNEDIQVRMNAKAGWAASQGSQCVVALNTELTEDLIREGIAKDAVRLIQDMRKKRQCNFTDRIEVTLQSDELTIQTAILENHDFICSETLSVRLTMDSSSMNVELEPVELADFTVQLGLIVVSA
jgi:isoleucyl-tRNA synthetase